MQRILSHILLLVVINSLSAYFAIAQRPTSDTSVRAEVVIAQLFGDSVVLATDRKPFHLIGDFNGDGANDLLSIVKLNVAPTALPKNVAVLNPWGYESSASSGKSNLALLIIHGSRNGWDPNPSAWFVLTDQEFFSTPIWQSPGQAGLIAVKKHSRGSPSRTRAKGDTITLATEAGIDITLYWDGRTYRLESPDEEP
jgi:hypothetical protein